MGKPAVLTLKQFLLAAVCVFLVAGCSRFRSQQINGSKYELANSFRPWGETATRLETATGRIVNVEAEHGLLKAETIDDVVYIKVPGQEIVVTPTAIIVNQRIAKVLTPEISDVDVRIKFDTTEFVVGGERFAHDQ